MTIGKGCNTIVQYVFFIVESIQTCFCNLKGPQDMDLWSEYAESAAGGRDSSSEDVNKLVVTNMFIYIGFLYPLCPNFWLFVVVGYVQAVHFGSKTDKLTRSQRPGFAFEFTEDSVIFGRVKWVVFSKVAGVEQIKVLRHVVVQIFGFDVIVI